MKACSSCGDRDLNWAMWQPRAPGRAPRGEGTGAAPVLLGAAVISTSTSVQPGAMSVLRKDRKMRGGRASGGEGGGSGEERVPDNDVGADPASFLLSGLCQQMGDQVSTLRLSPGVSQSPLASLTSASSSGSQLVALSVSLKFQLRLRCNCCLSSMAQLLACAAGQSQLM